MTRYLGLMPLQEPFDLGVLDDAGRVQVEFNVMAWKAPSDAIVAELVGILTAAGITATKIKASSKATIPREGDFLSLRITPGASPVGTHDLGPGAYRRPSVQIIARSASWEDAFALAQDAYSAFVAVRNANVA